MRGLRSFLVLFLVLIALGAYLYFVDSKRAPGDDAEKKPKVFAVEADTIDELTIKSESGERTTLRKSDAGWRLVSPAAAEADATEASGITTNLSNLEEQRLIEENPADLKAYGLAEPRIEVAFKAGGQDHRLLIGAKTPTGADLYAKTGAQPRVFLVPSYVESTFNRGTFDLRDKTALRFDRDQVNALEIVTADRPLRFTKSNGEWQIDQPKVARADAAAIESLVSRLGSLQMKKVVEGNIDTPQATVRVRSGSAEATLLIGGPAEEGEVYARDGSRPEIFTVESTLVDDLKKDAAEYRQKDIFDARSFNTTRVEIARNGESRTFEKAGDKWRQVAPEAKDVDAAKIEALLAALTAARAESFLEKSPAGAKTEAAVTVTFEQDRKESVTFLRSGTEALAARDDMTGVARIEAATLDGILKAIDEAK